VLYHSLSYYLLLPKPGLRYLLYTLIAVVIVTQVAQ
jgi:hypothetical protein